MRTLVPAATLFAHAPLFAALHAMMTAQDRIYPVVDLLDFSFMHKTPSLFGVRSMYDYEAQPPRRYTEFAVMMRLGREMRSINDWYYPGDWTPPGFARRLLDLTGARWVVAAPSADHVRDGIRPPLKLASETDGLRIYENAQALPRARYVPRVDVVPDDHQLLRRLAFGHDDLGAVALLEAAPPSGFTGIAGSEGTGTVEFLLDRPERVVLRVEASQRGFLFLADQHYPGWHASVNGERAPILRADYAFRLVEVPAGTSTVEFRYAPVTVPIGAAVSALTVLALALYGARQLRTGTSRGIVA
jgi:hypothetical protein